MAQLALLGGPKAVTKSVVGENGIASFILSSSADT